MRDVSETGDWYECIDNEKGVFRVGLTHNALKEIGPVVWYELVREGAHLQQGQVALVLESTKAAVDVAAPLSGIVLRVNEALKHINDEALILLNDQCDGNGWLYELQVDRDAK